MRRSRSTTLFVRLLLLSLAASALHGAVIVTLSVQPNTLSDGQTASLKALVTGTTNAGVSWSFTPTVAGATIGPPAGPDAAGTTTNSYTAPSPLNTTTTVTVTVTSLQDPSQTDSATITLRPVLDVGTGAPANLVNQFVTSFFRNGFNLKVSLPPLGNVKRLGTTGYVQEFNDAQKSGAKLALATVSPSAPPSGDGTAIGVVQLLGDLYAYYSSVGAAVAGLPLYDTLPCPPIDQTNSCTYDFFDKSYVLFAYSQPLFSGQNFTIRNVAGSTSILFYTEWTARGGIGGLGRPVDVERRHHGVPRSPRHYGYHRHHAGLRLRRDLLHYVRAQPQHPVQRNAAYLWRVCECPRSRRQSWPAYHARDCTFQWRSPSDIRRRRHTIHAGWRRPRGPAARLHRGAERRSPGQPA